MSSPGRPQRGSHRRPRGLRVVRPLARLPPPQSGDPAARGRPPGEEEAIAFVQKQSWQGATIGAVRRSDRWSLPPEAVREALINAVVHTDDSQRGAPIRLSIFDDRLEIENPGLQPFGLTVKDLPRGMSKRRNRVIGHVFQASRRAPHAFASPFPPGPRARGKPPMNLTPEQKARVDIAAHQEHQNSITLPEGRRIQLASPFWSL
jgi:Putative ATP-dependent DNA helicase recG C-terminal